MNKNDLRYIKTEKNIKEAFFKLIDEKGFEKTNVKDICDQCLISRNAFYTHYQSKEDLLEAIYVDVEYMFNDKFTTIFDIKKLTSIYLTIIDENRQLFYSLLRCPTIGFKKVILDTVILKPLENYHKKSIVYDKLPIKMRLTLTYMVEAMISFTIEWLANYDEIPLKDAIEELTILCTYPTNHNYELINQM